MSLFKMLVVRFSPRLPPLVVGLSIRA